MKKIFLLLAAACVTLSAAADEGMWMLPYLQKMNSKDMKARGCKLSAEEIYSMNNSSLKDAIVIFGGGHPHPPHFSFRIFPTGEYLAAYFDHKIIDSLIGQQLSYHIAGISFGYGRKIESNTSIGL